MRHDSPHPAEIMEGSGMIRPGIPCFMQVFSMAMALVVVLKAMMIYSFFSLMISYLNSGHGFMIRDASDIFSAITYMFVT